MQICLRHYAAPKCVPAPLHPIAPSPTFKSGAISAPTALYPLTLEPIPPLDLTPVSTTALMHRTTVAIKALGQQGSSVSEYSKETDDGKT